MKIRDFFAWLLFCIGCASMPAAAQSGRPNDIQKGLDALQWRSGTQPVTDRAAIVLPTGIVYLNSEDTAKFLELTGNLPEPQSYTIAPKDLSWFAIIDFSEIGFVKDSDRIEPDKLLANMRENQEAANRERQQKGLSPLVLEGWAVVPHYDRSTHNLEYGTRLKAADGENVNYATRLLGRHGITTATLISSPQDLDRNLGQFRVALRGFSYKPDERYTAFRSGDKVSEYGLAALITGGAAAAVVKAGGLKLLLAGLAAFWKVIAAGVVAAVAGIRRFLSRGREQT